MRKAFIATVMAAAVAGCASVPAQRFDVEAARTYAKSYDDTWSALVAYFAGNQIGIRTIEKDSGLIVADSEVNIGTPGVYTSDRSLMQGRILDLADCGTDPTNIPYGYVIRLNVLARSQPDGTRVTVNTQFRMLVATPSFVGPPTLSQRACNSTGKLEKAILDAVG